MGIIWVSDLLAGVLRDVTLQLSARVFVCKPPKIGQPRSPDSPTKPIPFLHRYVGAGIYP